MAVRLRPVVVGIGGGCERIAGLLLRRNNRSVVASLQLTNRQTRPICLRVRSTCSSLSSSLSSLSSSSSSSSSPVCIVLRRVQLISTNCSAQPRSSYSTLSPPPSPPPPSAASSTSGHDEIIVQRLDGLQVLSVPMPSRQERCRFVLKPLANTLSDFVAFLKAEDSAVERVAAYAEEGDVIPGRTSVEILFRRNFYLHINNDSYLVRAPEQPDDLVTTDGRIDDLSSVKDTVARLFRALNSAQFHADQQRRLLAQLEEVKVQLEPMEKVRLELHERAIRRSRALSWVGLGLMGLQFGFLARLTWWEYSWDIMEPVTYFVTCGTAMAMFSYHVLTLQDYAYPDAHDREVVMTIHRLAKKSGALDVATYNRLRAEKTRLEFDIDRLRHPLQIKLNPPHLPPLTSRPLLTNQKTTADVYET